uniref:LRRCT domain-containing protein n=1 Tax=Cyprinodon variegatus TaxID=28743 RepID=A0A3Q2CZ43_CYPVA
MPPLWPNFLEVPLLVLSHVVWADSGTVTCLPGGGQTDLPADIPRWTSTLILKGRNISTLPQGAFTVNGTELEMVTLSLSYNGIQIIEPYAFLGLHRLHLLDLSHNQLEIISSRAFHGLSELRSLFLNYSFSPGATGQLSGALSAQSLRNLHRLELAGNKLKFIPIKRLDIYNLHALVLINNSIENLGRENISSFYQQRRIRVYLALNPFRCNCELEVFYYWLKNSSGIPVAKLRGEDVDCMNENLEAVSYVFLGIVLALIGVGCCCLSPAVYGREAGYTLDRSPVHSCTMLFSSHKISQNTFTYKKYT